MPSSKLSALTTQALASATEFYIQRSNIEGKTTFSAIQSALSISMSQVTDTASYIRMTPAERTKLSGIEVGSDKIPLGTLFPYAGSSAPNSDYLVCDGQAISRTTYSSLYAIIVDTYGAGDGSTTFNLPDLRGRVPVGEGTGTATDATAKTLGAEAGTETHTLSIAEMPAHTHDIKLETDAWSGLTDTNATTGTGASTGSTGGGGAHNNMQPYIVLNYIIKVL